MNTVPIRHPYQGVLQILQFNWSSYALAAGSAGAALLAASLLPGTLRAAILLGAAPATFWLVSSLLVSHYVYDRYPLYNLGWIRRELAHTPERWINIHCGFDETSMLLHAIFPGTSGEIVDIFDPCLMTEASIHRARKIAHRDKPAMQAPYSALPFCNGSFDAAFCIFAAHELRSHSHRVALFGEVARILPARGEFVLVEHSRDWRNFLAFGPGFLHFFSPQEWRRVASEAGFLLRREFSRTPFVRVYLFRRAL